MLTDEQKQELLDTYGTRAMYDIGLDEAYRLGMERAAEIAAETSVLTIPHTHNWTALKVQETIIEAIRAAKGE